MKAHNVGFLSESWNIKKQLKEAEQSEMDLGDPRREITPELEETSNDPLNDKELVAKIKGMLEQYKKTKDKAMLRPIMEEMAKLYAPEAKEIVQKFENDKLKTTRGNYGKYMQVLSGLEGIHKGAMVFALRDAGAGQGLDDALRVIGGPR